MRHPALTPRTQDTWSLVHTVFARPECYLAGGTALALHLSHRVSEDLDFFVSGQAFDVDEEVAQRLAALSAPVAFEHRQANSLVAHVGRQEGKVSCFNLPKDVMIEPPGEIEGIRVAGVADLLAMKLIAIAQRGTLRDFVDVWAIEQRTALTVEQGMQSLAVRYPYAAPAEMRSNVLLGLAYFDDARTDHMPRFLDVPITPRQLETYWKRRVRSLGRLPRIIE